MSHGVFLHCSLINDVVVQGGYTKRLQVASWYMAYVYDRSTWSPWDILQIPMKKLETQNLVQGTFMWRVAQ